MGAETTGKGYAGIITHRNLRVSRDFCQATGLTFHSEKMNLEFWDNEFGINLRKWICDSAVWENEFGIFGKMNLWFCRMLHSEVNSDSHPSNFGNSDSHSSNFGKARLQLVRATGVLYYWFYLSQGISPRVFGGVVCAFRGHDLKRVGRSLDTGRVE